jgi:hypothetical protein
LGSTGLAALPIARVLPVFTVVTSLASGPCSGIPAPFCGGKSLAAPQLLED